MTAAEMLDALTREQVAIVGHYAAALVSERTRPGALAYFGELVGEQSAWWAVDFANAWHAQREREKVVTCPDIDALALVEALPESLRAGAAARLAAPVYDDADEAKAALLGNADMLRRRAARGAR
mgnify:FL=1